jgi:hypothetical protein
LIPVSNLGLKASSDSPLSEAAYCPRIDGQIIQHDSPVLIFPLFAYQNSLYAVVGVVEGPGAADFGQTDESFVCYFAYKSRLFSRFLLCRRVQEPLLLDMLQLEATETLVLNISKRLANAFDGRCCEICKLDKTVNSIVRFSVGNADGEWMKTA